MRSSGGRWQYAGELRHNAALFRGHANAALQVAGSIADIWPAKTRGWLMAAFAYAIFACTGTSLYIGTVIIIDLGFRWIGWITLILSLSLAAMYTCFLPETRANVLLYKKKRRTEKETGHTYYAIGEEERMASWRKLVTRSLTRPVCEWSA